MQRKLQEIKMNHSASVRKSLVMKPEVKRIFDDLDELFDFCRFELLPFNPADLYNKHSRVWQRYVNQHNPNHRHQHTSRPNTRYRTRDK